MIFRVLLGNVQNFSLFWKFLFWRLERVNVADRTGSARSLLVVKYRGVLLLLLFLGIFIADWFQSHIQRRWTDIKKHRICYVTFVQILHVTCWEIQTQQDFWCYCQHPGWWTRYTRLWRRSWVWWGGSWWCGSWGRMSILYCRGSQ